MAGIDFGNMNCYLAAARNKGIEVLMNDYSLHATPSCILFGQQSRLMGFGARQQLNMHYKNTVLYFKQLLGKQYSEEFIRLFGSSIPCDIVQLKNGDIGLKVMYLNEERIFTPEQVLACLFTHLRLLLSKSLGADINECVMSVPFYFDEKQRLAVIAAGKIASLKIRLINEHAALAYNYGIYKGMNLPKSEEPPKIVAFVDCGHSCIQTSLIALIAGNAKILSAAHTLEVGGHYFDLLLRDYFVVQFKEKYNIDVTKNPRAMFRLLDECEKLKKQITQFEEMAQHLFEKIYLMLHTLFERAQINVEDVSDVEIVGGSSRIPRIKQIIGEFFKKEPRTTMNQDDAIARGCALRSAMFYPAYQMKEFALEDPFDLVMEASKLPTEKSVAELLKIEKDMQAADQRATERSDAKNALEEYCFKMQHTFENTKACEGKVTEDVRLSCLNECSEVLEWLDMNSTELQKKQIECRHSELEKYCKPALSKLFAVSEAKKEKQADVSKQEDSNQNGKDQPNQDIEAKCEDENVGNKTMDSSNPKPECNDAEMD
uniref:Heat shock 70 kDa protein 4L n=1 Tax=Meloidogyne javanica TaxID=6303 RepID=A0A915N2S4_MELJA